MVQAIANLEPIVVSCHNCHFILPFIIVFPCHICLTVNCYYRLIGIIVMLEILEMIALSLWMEPTSVSQSMAENSTATSINPQAFDMRLHYALLIGLLYGLMDLMNVVSSQMLKYFAIPLHVFLAQMNTAKQKMVTFVRLFLK